MQAGYFHAIETSLVLFVLSIYTICMKKLTLLILTLCFMVSSGLAQQVPNLRTRVQKRVELKQSSLYGVVERELQGYYDRQVFVDPNHQTGWFRVDDFLAWVKKNASALEKESVRTTKETVSLKSIYANAKSWNYEPLYRTFWVYLGARYIADVYGVKADFSRLSVVFCQDMACAIAGTGSIVISPNSSEALPSIINMGMHEATHMLLYLSGNTEDQLSELATFYTQYNYGLPVRGQDALTLGDGVRDIRHTRRMRPDIDVLYEYNSFIAGHVLNKSIRPAEVLSFIKKGSEISILDVCFHLVALQQKRFFMNGLNKQTGATISLPEDVLPGYMDKMNFTQQDVQEWKARPGIEFYLGKFPWNKTPFMTSIHGDKIHVFVKKSDDVFIFSGGYSPIDKKTFLRELVGDKAPSLTKFYDNLAAYLPPDFVQDVQEAFSVQTTGMFLLSPTARKERNALQARHRKALENAVIQALKDSGAPPSPPVPKGYI